MQNPTKSRNDGYCMGIVYVGCFLFFIGMAFVLYENYCYYSDVCYSSPTLTGPCANVAPEDRQDCLNEPIYPDYDPGWNYTEEPTEYSPPPNSPENPQSGCPSGCISPPAGCDIKGNVSFDSGEKIYHLPGDPYYNQTVINPDYGERWFCTEQEAQANGWRHAGQ